MIKSYLLPVALVATYSTVMGEVHPLLSFRNKEVTCETPGPICNGCNESWVCIQVGGSLLAEKLQDCPAGTTCQSGLCKSDFNLECDLVGYEFVCHQLGMFPDPYRCNMYHMCCSSDNGFKESVHECPAGFQYNLLNTLCDKELQPNCEMLVQECKYPGQTGSITGHESMYYICIFSPNDKLYAQLFVCPNGQVWDNNKCVPRT